MLALMKSLWRMSITELCSNWFRLSRELQTDDKNLYMTLHVQDVA